MHRSIHTHRCPARAPLRLACLVAACLLLLMLPTLLGAAPSQEDPGVAPPQQVPGESFLPYLAAAFAVTWAGFFAYAFFVSSKQAELQREIQALRRTLERPDANNGAPH